MKNIIVILVFGLVFCSSRRGAADTITLTKHVEANGSVTFDGKEFVITCKTSDETIVRRYARNAVKSVELNDLEFNSGAPPQSVGMSMSGTKADLEVHQMDGRKMDRKATSKEEDGDWKDVVILRSGESEKGRLSEIRKGHVVFIMPRGPKDFRRAEVLSVNIANP